MAQTATLNRIGSRVKVDLDQVTDRIPVNLVKKLANDPKGKVLGYKMTDGSRIGLILELSDGSTSWFFDEEITNG